jgi:hypothetical protein
MFSLLLSFGADGDCWKLVCGKDVGVGMMAVWERWAEAGFN